jgi:hypothetical protein
MKEVREKGRMYIKEGRKNAKEGRKEGYQRRKERSGRRSLFYRSSYQGRKEGRTAIKEGRKEGRKATWIDVVARVPRRAIAVAFPVTGKQQLEGKKRKERRKEGRE